MVPDHASGLLRLRRRAQHMPAAAAVALFVSTAVLWLVTVQPASSISWGPGSWIPLTAERAVVLLTWAAGAFAILAGLFAIAVYAVHWPAIQLRENRQMLAQARAELADLQRKLARVAAQMAALRQLRAEIAMYEAQLARAQAEPAYGNGLELVDDIISELQSVGDRPPW